MDTLASLNAYEQYRRVDPEFFPQEEPLPVLPDLFMLGIDEPEMSPAAMAERIELLAGSDEAFEYLEDIRSTASALLEYADAAETVLVKTEISKYKEWQKEKVFLEFSLPRESWSYISNWIQAHLSGPCSELRSSSPFGWKSLTAFAAAVEEQFCSEMDDEDE